MSLTITSATHSLHAVIYAPDGQNLVVGDYRDASSLPGHPAIDVWEDGYVLCAAASGHFTVREIAFDSRGNLSRFAVDFVMECGSGPMFGAIRVASALGYQALDLQPASQQFDFSTQQIVGTATQQATITNAGTLPLSISAAITGTNAADFRLDSSSCASHNPLPAGAACSGSVTFTPHGLGSRSAILVLTDSTARSRHSFGLSGTGSGPPELTYPVDGQAGIDTTKPFTWTTSPEVQAYYLVVSTTPGGANLVNSGVLPSSQSSYDVPAMPAATLLYATLFAQVNAHWDHYQSIKFTAMAQVANFTFPVADGTNGDPAQPITWTTSSQAEGYYLVVGTVPGIANLINSGVLPASRSSYIPPPLPANTMLYATIFTKWSGTWNHYQSISYAYRAPNEATLTSPLNGERVVDSAARYTWSAFPQAQAYYFVVGTTPGGAEIINSGVLPGNWTSYPGVLLPKGVTLRATIFTKIDGSWNHYQTVSFTAG